MIIDAHHHLWQRNQPGFDYAWQDAEALAPIRRDFLPDDLKPLIRAAGVDRTILVQTQHHLAENRWALGLCDAHPCIAGVVGWVDLQAQSCEADLLAFAAHPKAVGIRHVTQDEPDDDFILRPAVVAGLKVLQKHGVGFDLLFYHRHLRHVPALAAKLPDLPMVIDHLSKPPLKGESLDQWKRDLQAAAACPNVCTKVSGLITEAHWDRWEVDDLRPAVQAALEAFGPERLLWGSDWPVCLLAGSYGEVKQAAEAALGPLSDDERAAIFGGNAQRFYQLDIDPT